MEVKMQYNFANGGLGSSDFMRNTKNRNFVFECISTDGAYFWYYCQLHTSYFYFLLMMILSACLAGAIQRRRTAYRAEECVPLLTVFGIMFYVMLFEANNRQLFNQLPWIILSALSGISHILYHPWAEIGINKRT